jgi:uncharacterized surface protein with fasciclin (FAS1) repeats
MVRAIGCSICAAKRFCEVALHEKGGVVMRRLLSGVAAVCLAGGLLLGQGVLSHANAADAYSVLQKEKRFNTWTKIIDVVYLYNYARGKRPYTLFARVEDSMKNIDPELMKAIAPSGGPGMLDTLQTNYVVHSHVALGKLPLDGFSGKVTTLQSDNGKNIVVDATKSPILVTFMGSSGTLDGDPIVTDNAIIYPVLLSEAHYTSQ